MQGVKRQIRASSPIQQSLDRLEQQVKAAGLSDEFVQQLRKQIQAAAAETSTPDSQQDFRALVEKFPDVVARFDRHYRYTYVTPHIEVYTGIPRERLMGKTHREAGFAPAICGMWEEKLTEIFSTGQPVSFEFDFVMPTGEQHWHQARLIPEFAGDKVSSVMCVGRNITEVRLAENEARDIHKRFMSTLEHITEGFAAFDKDWRYIYVNETVSRLLGMRSEDLIGKTTRELFPDHDTSQFVKQFEQVVAENKPREFEAFCKTQQAWFMCRCYPAAEGAVLFVTDITQRRAAEIALRDSEEHFRLLVEGVKDHALFLLDAEGRIASWNFGAQRIKGYRAEEVLGRHCSMCYTPEDVQQDLPKKNLECAAREGSCRFEGWMVGKNNVRFWAEMVITALRREDGSLRGFAEVARDMTDRKRAEEALKEAKERAETACAIKDQFLAVLSHELRTPLTPVLAAISMMESNRSPTAGDSEDVALIRRNVELEARLIDDLLDMTRITTGKVELRPEVIDLHDAIRQTLDICKGDINAKHLEVSLELNAENHAASVDPARMQQVLWNLLKNAVKFTPEYGRIWMRTSDLGKGRIRIEVGDTGMGIEADLLPRLFNAFEQGDKSTTRRFGGLGLGLTISKTIVDMHGGTLTASSEGKGKGATFTIELNTTSATPATTEDAHAPRPSTAAPLTVLFVEDHEDTRRIMARLLRASGYIVKTASGVHDALAILDSEHVDVLVSDLGLPDGSGYDIMQRIRDTGTKGIALSGYGMEEDVRHSEEAGFSRHLTKPIQPRDLNGAIRQVLAQ